MLLAETCYSVHSSSCHGVIATRNHLRMSRQCYTSVKNIYSVGATFKISATVEILEI
jgi:hypothetical protein